MSRGESPERSQECGADEGASRPRAVLYVRMSTEHQQYSTENQSDVLRAYALKHGMSIVRTYSDGGKSGLVADNRDSLQRLITDAQSPERDFDVILVYDVSRWGRFQDNDESAYYEFLCRRAGVEFHYCAEQFANDGSMSSSVFKAMKRVMAGEYSRELSAKVFQGQCRLIRLGFRQGGVAGYGLRRVLVDHTGAPKGILAMGEHKSIQTDRVILQPGPPEEVEAVRWMYRQFVGEGRDEREIAAVLNARGTLTDLGRPWTRATVHQVLTNEKYIGNNLYNRVSFKLKQRRVRNAPEDLVRAEGAFEPVVSMDLFVQAQQRIAQRSHRLSDDELLAWLARVYEQRGCLSALIIDEYDDGPSSATYRSRFGSLVRAYRMVGYVPARDYAYLEVNRRLRHLHPGVVAHITTALAAEGAVVTHDDDTDLLRVNGEFAVSVVIARCLRLPSGACRWIIRLDAPLRPDITVAVRMDRDNERLLDYYLLPSIGVPDGTLRLADVNGMCLDAYRFEDLDYLAALARRSQIEEFM